MIRFLSLVFFITVNFALNAQDGCNSNITAKIDHVQNQIIVNVSNNSESYIAEFYVWKEGEYVSIEKKTHTSNEIILSNLEKGSIYKVLIEFEERSGLCQFRQIGGLIF